MVKTILRLAGEHEKLSFVSDQRGHPTIAADLARMLVRFAREQLGGTWHVTNQGAVSSARVRPGGARRRWRRSESGERDHDGSAPTTTTGAAARELGVENRALREAGIELLPDFGTPSTCS